MLRSELIDTLHEENPHLTRFDVERVVAVVLESITQTLEKGARVELRGFGAFSVRYRKSRAGRNPRTAQVGFLCHSALIGPDSGRITTGGISWE